MKKKIPYYIYGLGILSPQITFDNSSFLTTVASYDTNALKCITPDFKEYINPQQLRRLSRMLRIGLTAATICLRDAENIPPDGIITATGYGFLDETAKFLNEIIQLNERQLTPTFFMQSTYNALAGLVALSLKCKGYNNTHVSRGFAFETALTDVMMQLNADTSKNYLLGAYDETEKGQYAINSRVGHYKREMINSLNLFQNSSMPGSIQGEGAAFFSMGCEFRKNAWCIMNDIKMVFNPKDSADLQQALNIFLNDNAITIADIDVWINGASGDANHDTILNHLGETIFPNTIQLRFKHLSGEYCTASAFGVWLGASVLKKQTIPASVRFDKIERTFPIRKVLSINQYMGRNYSFVLLSASLQ